MHLAVESHALDYLGAVGFERTPKVVEFDARNGGDEFVGKNARQIPLKRVVLTILSPTGADLEALIQLGHDPRNVLRIVLTISIKGNDNLTTRKVESGHHCSRLPEVAAEVNDFNLGMFLR